MSGDTPEDNTQLPEGVKVSILRAFKPGDVVLLRVTQPIPAEGFQRLSGQLKEFAHESGVKFVLLDHPLEVVAREEHEDRDGP